jgi:hypothetical protein
MASSPTKTTVTADSRDSKTAPAERKNGTRKATLPPGYEGTGQSNGHPPSAQNGPASSTRGLSLPTRLWRTVKSIYYASSPAWQFLKSGALFLFGLFCWSAANLLLSYEPSWHWPYFFMAYGFLLAPYGPFTHFVLVPHVIPWLRRRRRDSWLHLLGRHLTLTSLTLFFGAVLWLGLYPPSVMQMNFRAASSPGAIDVNPTLTCSEPTDREALISCRLDQTTGVGFISVESGGTQQLQRTEPPFAFSLNREHLVEVVGQLQFQVVVHNTEGTPVRRFNRTIPRVR